MPPDEAAGVERDPGDVGGVRAEARGEQPVGWPLLEQVEHDLDRVSQAEAGQVCAFVGTVVAQRYADMVDLAFDAELVEGLQPVQLVQPRGHPRVQLEEVDPVGPQPSQRRVDAGAQVPAGVATAHLGLIVVGVGPDDGLDLGGDVDPGAGPLLHGPADDVLAVA